MPKITQPAGRSQQWAPPPDYSRGEAFGSLEQADYIISSPPTLMGNGAILLFFNYVLFLSEGSLSISAALVTRDLSEEHQGTDLYLSLPLPRSFLLSYSFLSSLHRSAWDLSSDL